MTLLCTKLYKLSNHKQNKNSRPGHHAKALHDLTFPVEPNLSIPLVNLDKLGLLPLGPLSFCLESLSPREAHSTPLAFLCSTVTFSVDFKKLYIRA